jgi:hypothetical protein
VQLVVRNYLGMETLRQVDFLVNACPAPVLDEVTLDAGMPLLCDGSVTATAVSSNPDPRTVYTWYVYEAATNTIRSTSPALDAAHNGTSLLMKAGSLSGQLLPNT